MRFFFLLVLLLFVSGGLLAQETEAIRLEELARTLERDGDTAGAERLRREAKKIRAGNFFKKPSQTALENFPNEFLRNGTISIGIRNQWTAVGFSTGREWALDSGEIAFQNGSPYLPRTPIAYQNKRAYPFSDGLTSFGTNVTPNLTVLYLSPTGKWGLEYTSLQYGTSVFFRSYDPSQTPLWSLEQSQFQYQEHKLVLKIFEISSPRSRFSWDFGGKFAFWETNQKAVTPAQDRLERKTEFTRTISPSSGFRYYYLFLPWLQMEIGGDLLVSPFGTLQYKGQRTDSAFNSYAELQSRKGLEVRSLGLDLIWGFRLKKDRHSFLFGYQITSVSWVANESHVPHFFALSESALFKTIFEYYQSSGFYEADGVGSKWPSRGFQFSTIYMGYTYEI